jgi:hypothetical protein
MLDPGLIATVVLTSAYVLANFLGIYLLRSEGVILLVDSLYAEAIETVKPRAALFASSWVNLDSW